MRHADAYFEEAAEIAAKIDRDAVERMAVGLASVRDSGGRLFVLGVGAGPETPATR